MPDDSTRTVLVAIGADLGVALAKVGTAVFTGSSAVAAGAAEALADTANDVFLLIAQRRSSRPPDDQHPLGYGREAYFWALIAALGVFVTAAAFSLREGITELIHPSTSSSFAVAYIVLGISAVLDLASFRQSGGQMSLRARRYHRGLLEESRDAPETPADRASDLGHYANERALACAKRPANRSVGQPGNGTAASAAMCRGGALPGCGFPLSSGGRAIARGRRLRPRRRRGSRDRCRPSQTRTMRSARQ